MRYLLPLCLLLAPIAASAQVLVTELQYDPTSANDDGEWVEIHNIGAGAVDISGWGISSFSGTTESATRWTFPANTSIAGGQVMVIAKFASGPGYVDNTPANLYAPPAPGPSFECATAARNDATVPDMIPVGGTTVWAFGNGGGGSGVVLRNGAGAYVSGVEYGTNDKTEIPGAPITGGGSATSLRRIANTGLNQNDFAVAQTPDPFVGYAANAPTPPTISNVASFPRHYVHGALFTVTASIADAQGVASAALYTATATAADARAAVAPYTATPMVGVNGSYGVSITPAFPVGSPATFHERYLRFWVSAEDTGGADATFPAGATVAAGNGAFVSRNVMPTGPSPLADVRAQDAGGLLWPLHSATVEGVVLTRHEAFVANRPNFFIHEVGTNEAIRVFSSVAIATTVAPGDLVRVTGMTDMFNGVRQLGEPGLQVLVLGTAAVPTSVHTIADLLANGEQLESQLVRVNAVSLMPAAATWPANGNVTITDGTGTLTVRVVTTVDLGGSATPAGTFDIIGIFSQFAANNVGGYQLQPRSAADVLPPGGMVDAGVIDGGLVVDGGGPSNDGAVSDTGPVVSPDAAELPDTGVVETDTGVVETDSGVVETDSGEIESDSGVVETDSGVVETDSGVVPPDATAGLDAAPTTDGSVRADASTPRDASVRIDAGITVETDEGCGCETAGAPSSSGPGSAALMLLAVVGLGLVRRRR